MLPPQIEIPSDDIQSNIALELEGAVVQRAIEKTLPEVATDIVSLEQNQLNELEYQEKRQKETEVS